MQLRTRATAPSEFVRGLRWAISRRNSKLCPFFCRGKRWPDRRRPTRFQRRSVQLDTLALSRAIPSRCRQWQRWHPWSHVLNRFHVAGHFSASTTTCRLFMQLPSFSSTNENPFLESRRVRTQPLTVTVSSGWASCSNFAIRWSGMGEALRDELT